jgi:hypothetical protein
MNLQLEPRAISEVNQSFRAIILENPRIEGRLFQAILPGPTNGAFYCE